MNDNNGTLITKKIHESGRRLISGITHLSNRIQIRVRLSENEGNSRYRNLLEILSKNKISLDLINIFPAHQIFTIDVSELPKLKMILNEANIQFSYIENCSTVAIVGIGMQGVPGVMAKIVNTLSENNIEVLQTADSNMTIWCLINTENLKDAVNLLHKEFNLGETN